jgi:hypothetical protein
MKLKYIALLILLTASSNSFAINSFLWNKIDENSKTWIIAGIFEGVKMGQNLGAIGCYGKNMEVDDITADSCQRKSQKIYSEAFEKYMQPKNNQIRLELDAFYADPRNQYIEVNMATFYIVKRLAGDPITDFFLQNIRNTSNAQGK